MRSRNSRSNSSRTPSSFQPSQASAVARAHLPPPLEFTSQRVGNCPTWTATLDEAGGVQGVDPSGKTRGTDTAGRVDRGANDTLNWLSTRICACILLRADTLERPYSGRGSASVTAPCCEFGSIAVCSLMDGFKFSPDPNLVDKVTDIVGLYLRPPEKSSGPLRSGPLRR